MNPWTALTDFFQYDFLFRALLGCIFVSVACGIVSPLIVAKRYAFMGTAVSHSTFLGLSIALSVVSSENPFLVFLITLGITLILVTGLAKATFRQKLPSDSLIGIFFTSSMGIGVIIHFLFARQRGDLLGYLFGNILLLENQDMILSLVLMLSLIPLFFIPFKKWLYVIYDEEGALVSGINIKFFHYLFFLVLTFLIVSALKLAGTVLIETLLLIPGVFSLKNGRNIKQVFIFSISFSIFSSVLGLYLANLWDLPSGATMAVTQLIILLGFLFFKKIKGGN
ncbi:MAG: metal ABC transporter permease [Bacteriovoracales bacterium]|jgi:ABC-type Mn2+/Zn2+ transport system permease subunit